MYKRPKQEHVYDQQQESLIATMAQQKNYKWHDDVTDLGSLPMTGNSVDDIRKVLSDGFVRRWDGSDWVLVIPSGVSEYNAVDVTYSDLKELYDTGGMKPGSYYKITDFRTVNESYGLLNVAPIEPIIVKAVSGGLLDVNAQSTLHPTEILKYDISKSAITKQISGGWDSGGDRGDDVTISNVTATTFDINKTVDWNEYYYMYFEDGNNGYEYDEEGYGTDFIATDLGGGNTRITFNLPIDFLDGSGYIELEISLKFADKYGDITYRENPERGIKTSFDFRGHKVARAKIDYSGIGTYNAGTTYHYRDTLLYNGDIMMCMADEITGISPGNSYFWILIVDGYEHAYIPTNQDLNFGTWIQIDGSSKKLFNSLGLWNENAETNVFSLDGFKNLEVKSKDVVFFGRDYPRVQDVVIGVNCENISVYGSMQSMKIGGSSFNIYVGKGGTLNGSDIKPSSYGLAITGQVDACNIGRLVESTLRTVRKVDIGSGGGLFINNAQNGVIANGHSNYRFGSSCVNFNIGSGYMLYVRSISKSSIGSGISNVVISCDIRFENNQIGNSMQYITIKNSYFEKNIIDNKFGGYNSSKTMNITFNMFDNIVGNNVFYQGTTSITNNLNQCNIGNDVYGLSGNDIFGVTFGTGCLNISGTSIGWGRFGVKCQNIDLGAGINTFEFQDYVKNVTLTGLPIIYAVTFHHFVDGLSIPSTATGVRNNASKDIVRGINNGQYILKYIDGTNTEQLVDPTL